MRCGSLGLASQASRAGGTSSHQGAAWDQGGGRPGAEPRWEGARRLPPRAVLEDFQPSLGRVQWVPRGGCEQQQGCGARL